jgi:UDP-glucose 4-epimerase
MQHILITGASGLIGRHAIDLLLGGDNRIYAHYNSATPGLTDEKLTWFKADLRESLPPGIIPEKLDAVIHCAALQPTSYNSDELCYNTNKLIDKTILDLCENDPASKIAYLSSIYLERYPENELANNSKYLYQKRQTEIRLAGMKNPWASFRISSPYGIHQTYRNVFKIFMEKALNGEDLVIHGSGSRTQDFVAANDVAEAIRQFLPSDITKGIFNVCSAEPVSMKELAEKIRLGSGNDIGIKNSGQPDAQEDYRVNFSNKDTAITLGWRPHTSLQQGINDWFKFLRQ